MPIDSEKWKKFQQGLNKGLGPKPSPEEDEEERRRKEEAMRKAREEALKKIQGY